jgi:hypothetical protein
MSFSVYNETGKITVSLNNFDILLQEGGVNSEYT